ncbi:MAG TPA: L-2-amino-thiazoline-4-carboxylic acid hydrolase [Treponemataceae bacterium]|nr:L-2-amino-thiazoline-4-carboxylic acid hydrolase [Treponemataceae bacterium]
MYRKKMMIPLVSVTVVVGALAVVTLFKKNQACKSFCAGCNGCKNLQDKSVSYYVDKEARLQNDLQKKQKLFKPALTRYYGAGAIDGIVEETKAEFQRLVAGIPYIGGDKNPMTEDIEQAAMALALYRVQKRHGRTTQEIGEIITGSIQREIEGYPKWLRHIVGGKFFTEKYKREQCDNCAESQKREWAGNWVSFYVEGDGTAFDYGFDHAECGIVKYLTVNGASDIIPYLCSLDFIYSDAFDEGLTRTTTLAENGPRCDFRYKRKD